jgi:hypothetical protein
MANTKKNNKANTKQAARQQEMAPQPGRYHRAVRLRVGEWEADIDVGIAPLIRELWKAGIETCISCQEDGRGRVWIGFRSLDGLKRFLDSVMVYEDGVDTLYNHILDNWDGDLSAPKWQIDIAPDDLGLGFDDEEEWHDGEVCIDFSFHVRFPPCDLPVVLKRMRRHNARARKAAGRQEAKPAGLGRAPDGKEAARVQGEGQRAEEPLANCHPDCGRMAG